MAEFWFADPCLITLPMVSNGRPKPSLYSETIHPLLEIGAAMKNPFMSIFLSAANRAAGSARAQATAAVKRETAKTAKQLTTAWTDAMLPPVAAPRRKKRPTK
jgi:hypothetical protein